MAQHDYVLANASGAVYRGDNNDALLAIATMNSGATAPSTTYAYMPYVNTSDGRLYQRNAANTAWIDHGLVADRVLRSGDIGVSAGNLQQVDQLETTTASGATIALGETLHHGITGTAAIAAFSGVAGVCYRCRAAGAFTLTHHPTNLILPGAANIIAGDGDTFDVYMVTASTCYVFNYHRSNGFSLGFGGVVGSGYTETGAVSTGTTVLPIDDTIPQSTEGDQYLSLAYAPKNAANDIYIEFIGYFSASSDGIFSCALFKDSDSGAMAVASNRIVGANSPVMICLRHKMTAGTTSEVTFKIRAGMAGAATLTFNGVSGARRFGGVFSSSIRVLEVAA